MIERAGREGQTVEQLLASEHGRFAAHLTGRAGNTGQLANTLERAGSKSSAASSRHSKLPRAWASKGNFANGSSSCRLANRVRVERPNRAQRKCELKAPLTIDVCLMAYENRAIVGYEAPMKTLLSVLMVALSLITGAVRVKIPQEATIKLSSPDFSEGENIPERFTCDGKDISPTLKIDGVPKEAKSLVLIVDDPDAPAGNFTHWLMWNVVPDLTEIAANKPLSHAVQGVNDFGKSKYSGPCPPPGIHRYYFSLYALDTTLALPPTSKRIGPYHKYDVDGRRATSRNRPRSQHHIFPRDGPARPPKRPASSPSPARDAL